MVEEGEIFDITTFIDRKVKRGMEEAVKGLQNQKKHVYEAIESGLNGIFDRDCYRMSIGLVDGFNITIARLSEENECKAGVQNYFSKAIQEIISEVNGAGKYVVEVVEEDRKEDSVTMYFTLCDATKMVLGLIKVSDVKKISDEKSDRGQ